MDSAIKLCGRNGRKCSKGAGHPYGCDKKRTYDSFWESSSAIKKKVLDTHINKLQDEKAELNTAISEAKMEVSDINDTKTELEREVSLVNREKQKLQEELYKLNQTFEKFKYLIEQKQYAKTKREKNPTNFDSKTSTKYERQAESKQFLEFLHGGLDGAIYGAWSFLERYAAKDLIEKFVLSYKRGKFIENLYGNFSKSFQKSEKGMHQALATKYESYLSRRKYDFVCKIQSSTFDSENQEWCNKSINYGDREIILSEKTISNYRINNFVKGLNIGDINIIPGFCGASRTVTALTTMIIDVNLKVKSLKDKLIWFNDVENHYVIEFSDDGAPESKDNTMSIGTMTCWNLGNRVRSRDYQYLLHTISCGEKEDVVAALWKQHTEEMLLIEGNVLHINDKKITVEYQPSADQAWQCFSNSVLPTTATLPSLFADVHKNDISFIGGSIGNGDTSKWQVPIMATRKHELEMLQKFCKTLKPDLPEKRKHAKKLEFMALNGLRQLDEPIIGLFADRQRPEPFHLEVNNWQHVLDVIYKESLKRCCTDQVIDILKKATNDNGCGLKQIGRNMAEHFNNEKTRYVKLTDRIIGAQAILLSKYSLRIIDCLKTDNESEIEKYVRSALSKICETLRCIGTLFNRVFVSRAYTMELSEMCTLYFNLFSLFFKQSCNSTVWTIGYAVPYHANLLFEQYGIGYGILSMQGKEARHSSIKQELRCGTNRSTSEDNNKWNQIMRASFVRTFYLPYHFPVKAYQPHYESRNPTVTENMCQCYRPLTPESDICDSCSTGNIFIESVQNGMLPLVIAHLLKPLLCTICDLRFADNLEMNRHNCLNKDASNIIPKELSVKQLRQILTDKGCSTTGNKAVLCARLEGELTL